MALATSTSPKPLALESGLEYCGRGGREEACGHDVCVVGDYGVSEDAEEADVACGEVEEERNGRELGGGRLWVGSARIFLNDFLDQLCIEVDFLAVLRGSLPY